MKRAVYKPSNHPLILYRMGGYTLSETVYPSELRQPRHTHEPASFSFVLTGSFIENYERRAELRRRHELVFRPPHESHSVEFRERAVRILSVQFDFSQLERIRRHSDVLDRPAICRTETIAGLSRRLLRELRRTDALSPLAVEGLILEILVEAARSSTGRAEKGFPRWLSETKDFLHAHFTESFTLEDAARAGGVHPVYLARVFREKFGCTVGEYVRNLRVDFACRKISASDLPLSEIALAAGFADQSHLTKTFKNRYGFTPSEYRKIFRQG